MPQKRLSQQERVLQWLRERNAAAIDEATAAEAAAALPGVSTKSLREAFLASALPLAPVVEGVRQDSVENLERTLGTLAAEYAVSAPDRQKLIRAIVITARQHAGWAERNRKLDAAKREEKAEAVLWLRTWLENPPLFPAWAAIRVKTLDARQE
jgi:hypothetical protein